MIRPCLVLVVCFCISPLVAAESSPTAERSNALGRYVAEPDDAYAWELVHRSNEHGATTYIVNMTSQKWLTESEVDRTLWQHSLVIVKPDNAVANTAMLFIGGGRNGQELPQTASDRTRQIAVATRSVVAELGMVPNQPLMFHNDGVGRYEDDLIAYAWDQALKGSGPKWLPRLPMVKSAVRAMDTVQAVLRDDSAAPLTIEQFIVAGGSKRGWTTWMTAAVDERVCAIIPIVIDVLNVKRSMDHHYAAYGFWAPAIGDYVNHKITHRRNLPEYAALLKLVDPYAYRARFEMPKCIINATGDQFFLPDSSRFYFADLPGEKHLSYLPNSDHSLSGTSVLETIAAFHHAIVNDSPRPEFSWTFPDPTTIRVTSKTPPKQVILWQATNPAARDFRVLSIGKAYQSITLQAGAAGEYSAKVRKPEKGWTAFYVQLEFDVGAPTSLWLSTPVRVVPDLLPYADKRAPLIGDG